MNPEVGRALWLVLHKWAEQLPLSLDASEHAVAADYLRSWQALVRSHSNSCGCSVLLDDFIQRVPLQLEHGQSAVMAWCARLHNEVNAKLGKPHFTPKPTKAGRWAVLHEYAWRLTRQPGAMDSQATREWYAGWRQRHFCGACGASPVWLPMELDLEVVKDPETFYWWTVAAHDRWNLSQGRPMHAANWSSQHPLLKDLPLRNFKKD